MTRAAAWLLMGCVRATVTTNSAASSPYGPRGSSTPDSAPVRTFAAPVVSNAVPKASMQATSTMTGHSTAPYASSG